jgi:hypothetical protein
MMEEASDAKLEMLQAQIDAARAQIDEEEKKINQLSRVAAIAGYNDIKINLTKEFSSSLVALLRQKISENPEAQKEAIKDLEDKTIPARVRLAIALELFRNTSNKIYLDTCSLLLRQNKEVADRYTWEIGNLFSRDFSEEQQKVVIPVIVGFIIDERFNPFFRDQLLYTPGINSKDLYQVVGKEEIIKTIKYIGTRLIETLADKEAHCYRITFLESLLGNLSNEAQVVYSYKALEKPLASEKQDERECIKKELNKAVGGNSPTPEMVNRWLVL